MGLLDKIRNALLPKAVAEPGRKNVDAGFEQVIADSWKEYAATHNSFWEANLNETRTWTDDVKQWPDKKKVTFILWLIAEIHGFNAKREQWNSADKAQQYDTIRNAYLRTLFRNKLIMDDEDAARIYESFHAHRIRDWGSFTHWPVALMLNQLEKQRKGQVAGPELRRVLEAMKADIAAVRLSYDEKERIKWQEKIDAMLFNREAAGTDVKPVRFMGDDPFAAMANADIERLPHEERRLWYQLLQQAQKASGTKPSKRYLDESKSIIKELGADKFKKTMHEWLRFLVNLKEHEQQHTHTYHNGASYNYISVEYLTAVNAEAVKGLIWACAHFHDNTTIQTIAALAGKSFP